MIYKACLELGVWPMSRVVKVDDSESGIEEGINAGCFTIGVAASGNGIGLPQEAFAALGEPERKTRLSIAGDKLKAVGANMVIDTIRDLIPTLDAIPREFGREAEI